MKIMKKKLLALGLACAALFAGHDAMATDLEITAQATIAQPITLTKDTDNTYGTTGGNLSFGTIIPGDSWGWVYITPTNNTGTEYEISSPDNITISGNYGTAVFTVKGSPNALIDISVPESSVILTNENDNELWVNIYQPNTNTLDDTGTTVIGIAGELNVPNTGAAATGTYTGTFYITVNYQ